MRLDYRKVFTSGFEAMIGLQRSIADGGLEPLLLELVKIRASQINGCAYCIDMHTKDARALGETEQRIYALSAWHEAPFYSERERAALEWAEAVTRVGDTHVPDDVYAELEAQFSPEEIAALTYAIVAINGWNRLAVGFRSPVGRYVSRYAKGDRSAA